jgi:sortase A
VIGNPVARETVRATDSGVADTMAGERDSPAHEESEATAPSAAAAGPGNVPTRRGAGPGRQMVRSALLVLTALAFSIVLEAVVGSGLQHQAAQARAYAKLRYELAEGTAPVAAAGSSNHSTPLGAPVALLEIPSVHLREVVGEGTTSGVLMSGPGHRRDTPFPGQAGTSVIFGRAAAYGGPFKRLDRLRVGTKIMVTTGQGVSTFKVIGRRQAGDPAPAPTGPGQGRLQLVTATGLPFVPSGVLRVDADLVTSTFDSASTAARALPKAEGPLGTDWSTPWALVLWLEALMVIAVGAMWCWVQWGHVQTWIVFLPLGVLAGLAASGQFLRLLPNLL